MSARSSSLRPVGLGQLAIARPPAPGEHPGLLVCLAAIPDPRRAEGRRHPFAFVLALAACAALTGAKSFAAIAEWAADAPPAVLATLGGPAREPPGPTTPSKATVRRVGASEIALRVRGRWGIENRIHHVRETSWTEDASRVCTGPAPRGMVGLRHLALGAFRLTGHTGIAAGLRHRARNATRSLVILCIT
ncbi:transposase family protein [Streptomyces sp. NBC_01320]|uniref:transposase family protein n=1 Tax=Streptomyces sp. NBC_01320 TaxID=2903824 RepID=UPI002E1415A6|nr:transposase family protein [Streptomyces sp. NBC_01320]